MGNTSQNVGWLQISTFPANKLLRIISHLMHGSCYWAHWIPVSHRRGIIQGQFWKVTSARKIFDKSADINPELGCNSCFFFFFIFLFGFFSYTSSPPSFLLLNIKLSCVGRFLSKRRGSSWIFRTSGVELQRFWRLSFKIILDRGTRNRSIPFLNIALFPYVECSSSLAQDKDL